jgi:PIN domain nuclease of toxin-antitoxin system
VRVLLDTHALLWSLEGNANLSSTAREVIENEGNEVLVSVVSAWEMSVKRALGKLTAPYELEEALAEVGFIQRLVRFADCNRLSALPPIHRDPFDRMLISQAMEDGIPLVTKDELISRYPLQTIW